MRIRCITRNMLDICHIFEYFERYTESAAIVPLSCSFGVSLAHRHRGGYTQSAANGYGRCGFSVSGDTPNLPLSGMVAADSVYQEIHRIRRYRVW